MKTKLEHLATKLQQELLMSLVLDGVNCEANRLNCQTRIVEGKKYTKVNIGGSGRYMVDNATGEIFGIKGYGVIHRGHQYGTLDTINDYWWGDYTAVPVDKSRKAQAVAAYTALTPNHERQ